MLKKVIIDCDPGHDDIMAILSVLAHPETFDLLGITTVTGNNLVDKVTDTMMHRYGAKRAMQVPKFMQKYKV